MEIIPPSDIHQEDTDLYLALAQLQSMHNTLRKTRHAPTGVISPLRNAARSATQPSPQLLAAQISKAAVQGRQDILALKSIWKSETFRKYSKEASAADLNQGSDSWDVDYEALGKELRKRVKVEKVEAEEEIESIEEARRAVEEFGKGQRKGLLSRTGQGDALGQVILEVGRLKFVIDRGESAYLINASSKDGFVRPQQIIEYVSRTPAIRKLEKLLDLLEAYHDIGRHQCETCKNLFDDDLAFTTVRREGCAGEGNAKSWLAYHTKCES